MSSEAQLSTVYATDEDVCIRAYGDYLSLCPSDQILAGGSDGVLASSGWTLTSASQNFETQGVAVGNVIQIKGAAPYGGNGQKFAVGAVSGNTLTLRRIGKGDGIGMPPGPSGGLTGLTFLIKTFGPQIEDASYEINTKFGIDPNWAQCSPNLIYDQRVLRQATVLTVLVRAYTSDARTKDGDFALKIAQFKQALSDALAICQVRWNQTTNIPPPTSLFGLRLVR